MGVVVPMRLSWSGWQMVQDQEQVFGNAPARSFFDLLKAARAWRGWLNPNTIDLARKLL
jgi:hypothetical protein